MNHKQMEQLSDDYLRTIEYFKKYPRIYQAWVQPGNHPFGYLFRYLPRLKYGVVLCATQLKHEINCYGAENFEYIPRDIVDAVQQLDIPANIDVNFEVSEEQLKNMAYVQQLADKHRQNGFP